jgi:hypothetical protein
MRPQRVGGDAVEDDRMRRGGDHPQRHERGLPAGDAREDERPRGGLPVQPVELLGGQPRDRLDGVDDGVAADGGVLAGGDDRRIDRVDERVDRLCGGVLPEVLDDVRLEARREDARMVADVRAAAVGVDGEQPRDDAADDADAGALAAAALVVADDRRGHIERCGEVGLGDLEVGAPLADRRPGLGGQRDLPGDAVRELRARPVAHGADTPVIAADGASGD